MNQSLSRAAALLAATFLASSLPSQEQRRIYDVTSLIQPLPTDGRGDEDSVLLWTPPRLPLRRALRSEQESFAHGDYPKPTLEWDQLKSLLEDHCLGGKLDEDKLYLHNRKIYLTAPPATQAKIKTFLQQLEKITHQRLEIRLHFLPKDTLLDQLPASLDAATARQVLTEQAPVRTLRAIIAANTADTIRSGKSTAILYDYDVEVAQKAAIADPKVRRVFDGTNVIVLPAIMPDGRIAVRLVATESNLQRPVKKRPLNQTNLGKLQQPILTTRSIWTAAILRDGGGLLFGSKSDDHGACMLEVRRLNPRPDAAAKKAAVRPNGRFTTVPLGDLIHPPFRWSTEFLELLRPRLRNEGEFEVSEDENSEIDDEKAQRLVMHAFDGRLARDDLEWKIVANHVLIKLPATDDAGQTDARVRRRIDALAKAFRDTQAQRRTITLHYRLGRVPQETAARYLRGQLPLDELAKSLSRSGVVPALMNQTFRVVNGTERTFIRDHEVEIAEKSAMADPVIDVEFSGMAMVGTLTRGLSGQLRCSGKFIYCAQPELKPLDTELKELGQVDVVQTRFTQATISLEMGSNKKWQVAHMQALPGTKESVVLLIKAR